MNVETKENNRPIIDTTNNTKKNVINYPCANCGKEITKLNDDTPKKNFCDNCESPNCDPVQRRAFIEKNKPDQIPKPEETKIPLPTQLQLIFSSLNYEQFLDEEEKFRSALCAKVICQVSNFKYDRKTGFFYYYDNLDHVWKPNAEVFIQEILGILLDESNSKHIFNDIVHCIKSICMAEVVFSTEKIAVENGLLNPITLELTPFNPKEMIRHHIKVKLDPKAKCEDWIAYLKQCLPKEDILLLQEWSGFLLLPNYSFHKILWMYGKGRNGKGVWCRTMEALLGEENCSSIGLEEFSGNRRFSVANLYNSLFNPCCEPLSKYPLPTPLLKKITGQDTIDAEIKGKQQRLKFKNYAKITPIGNEFPKVKDRTTSFRERTIFILWPNEFTGKIQTQDVERKWLETPTSRSAILNWMLEGLQRLLLNGQFTKSHSQEEMEIAFLRSSDSIYAFLSELGVLDKNRLTTRNEAYEVYKDYCELYGLENETNKTFTQALRETKGIKDTTKRIEGKKTRVWSGLGFKKLPGEENNDENGTGGTEGTVSYPPKIQTKLNNIGVLDHVPIVPSVPFSDKVSNFEVLKTEVLGNIPYFEECYFCGKILKDEDKIASGPKSENKKCHLSCYPVTPSKEDSIVVSEEKSDGKPVVFVKYSSNPDEVCFYCKDPVEYHLVDSVHETPVCRKCLKEKESAIKEHYCLKKMEVS